MYVDQKYELLIKYVPNKPPFLNTGILKIDSQRYTLFLRELSVLHLTVNLLFNSCVINFTKSYKTHKI